MPRSHKNATTVKGILVGLLIFSIAYLWGSLTIYKQIFPFEQLKLVKNAVLPNAVLNESSDVNRFAPNTNWQGRRDQFKIFGRQADVVMIGDSITHFGHWEDIFPGVRIANRGISADRTDDILRRIDTILSVKPKKAFIMIGINDINMGRNVDEVFTDYIKIINELQKTNIQIFIQSTLECSNCGERLGKVRLLNQKLKQLAVERKLTYININDGLTNKEEGLLSEYTSDGIHLTGSGYIKWNQTIEPYISSN